MIPILLCDAVCEIVEFLRPIQVVQFHTNLHMEFLLIQRLKPARQCRFVWNSLRRKGLCGKQ